MQINAITPMLTVIALDPAVAFYRDTLGFTLLNATDAWAALATGASEPRPELMLALPNAHLPFEKPILTGSLYFNVTDVDQWWQRLSSNCTIEYPIETFDYGMREFAIRDNSGYLLQFGQEIATDSQ